jgi:cysteinyl-tRNA synthetase
MFKLTNTLTGTQEEFSPLDDSGVRMYSCGPTVHDFVHIGNFRTFVFQDVLRRHVKSKGWALRQVMNITDVDDKIIRKALAEGVDIQTYTEKYTTSFLEDSDKLGIERPEVIARATEHVPEMVALVKRLLDQGHAYREGDSIYFRISSFADYGRLARLDKSQLKVGARVEVDEYEKESPQDFVLWKAPKEEDEPSWDTEIGVGRPGWHLECSAMAMKYLGESFDLHCGGIDLIFPHHENEIAQSQAATGAPFVRFWVHGEFLKVEGEKMAKSTGNFYRLRDLLDKGFDPLAIRYLLVSVPYRKQLNFTFDGLHQASQSLGRIQAFLFRLKEMSIGPGESARLVEALNTARTQFESGLDDDLNTAQALAAVFDLIRACNTALDAGELLEDNRAAIGTWFVEVDRRLGIVPPAEESPDLDQEIEALIAQRTKARADRDFARADQVRQQLTDMNVIIEDTREGTRWRRK